MPPEVDALPSVLTKCVTHPCWMVVLFATPVSWGSLPVKFLPVAALTPLPASGFQGSVAVCAPYFFTEKPSSVVRPGPRFARLSSMGIHALSHDVQECQHPRLGAIDHPIFEVRKIAPARAARIGHRGHAGAEREAIRRK